MSVTSIKATSLPWISSSFPTAKNRKSPLIANKAYAHHANLALSLFETHSCQLDHLAALTLLLDMLTCARLRLNLLPLPFLDGQISVALPHCW